MADFILRKAALDSLCSGCEYVPIEEKENCPYRFTGCQEYANIFAIPAADVRPVVRGKWIDRWYCSNMSGYEYAMKCSVCENPTYRISLAEKMPNYCPNCGADMREVEHDGA